MKAMILAAGEGTRLRPLTASLPKPMVPIVGKPLLAWTLSWLAGQGVTDAIVNLYHRPQSILDFLGTEYAGVSVQYLFEDTLLGTAGAVKNAARFLDDAPFYVIYGDNLIHADLNLLAAFHHKHQALATIGLFRHPNPTAAGIVGVDDDGRVSRFVEKPPADGVFADTANAGVYVLDPAIFDFLAPVMPLDFGRDVFPSLLQQQMLLYGTLLGGYLHDTGTPDQYRQANWDALDGKAGTEFSSDRLWVGDDCSISASAKFKGRNILGRGVVVDAGASLTDCIIWDRAQIGTGAHLVGTIVGQDTVVPPGGHPEPGAILASSEGQL